MHKSQECGARGAQASSLRDPQTQVLLCMLLGTLSPSPQPRHPSSSQPLFKPALPLWSFSSQDSGRPATGAPCSCSRRLAPSGPHPPPREHPDSCVFSQHLIKMLFNKKKYFL